MNQAALLRAFQHPIADRRPCSCAEEMRSTVPCRPCNFDWKLIPVHDRPAIDELLRLLPPKATRQTMLFSATYPSNIASLAGFALRPGFATIDTVGEDAEQTADKVCLDCRGAHCMVTGKGTLCCVYQIVRPTMWTGQALAAPVGTP